MRSALIVFLFFFVSVVVIDARTFTNREGKQIKAEVIAVRQGQVYLKMNDREFAVPFSSLSDSDQQYLREWVKKNIDYNLSIDAQPIENKEARQSSRSNNLPNDGKLVGGNYSARTRTESQIKAIEFWNFEVEFTNRTRVALPESVVHYMIIVRDDEFRKSRNDHSLIGYFGHKTLNSIPSMENLTFSTPSLLLREIEWTTTEYVNNPEGGTDERETDYQRKGVLDQILIKVFVGNRKVAEWISRGDKPKELPFVFDDEFQSIADSDNAETLKDRSLRYSDLSKAMENRTATEQQRRDYYLFSKYTAKAMKPPPEMTPARARAVQAYQQDQSPSRFPISEVVP